MQQLGRQFREAYKAFTVAQPQQSQYEPDHHEDIASRTRCQHSNSAGRTTTPIPIPTSHAARAINAQPPTLSHICELEPARALTTTVRTLNDDYITCRHGVDRTQKDDEQEAHIAAK